MPEIRFRPAADDALNALESDPTQDELLRRIEHVLDDLEADPSASHLRRRRFTKPPVFAVTVRPPGDDDDWIILWLPVTDPSSGEEFSRVVYIGPSSF